MKKFKPQEGGHRLYLDDFIVMQESYEEAINQLCKMFKKSGDNTPIIIHGLETTTSGNTTHIRSGSVWFNNELFIVDEYSIGSSQYQNLFLKINEIEIPNIDPIEYKDTSLRNFIHVDRILEFKIYNSGDGDIDGVNGFYFRNLTKPDMVPLGVIVDFFPKDSQDLANSFDSNGLGIGRMDGWAICNGKNGTIDLRGLFTMMASRDMRNSNALHTKAISNVSYGTIIGDRGTNIIIQKSNLPNYNLNVIDSGHTHISYSQGGSKIVGRNLGSTGEPAGSFDNISSTTSSATTNIIVQLGGNGTPISINTVSPAFALIKIMKIR